MSSSSENARRLATRINAADSPGLAPLVSLSVGVVIVAALWVAREVLIPLTLAVFLAFVLGPVVAALKRLRLPRTLAVLVAALMALGVVLVLGAVIGVQIAQLSADLPRYTVTIDQKVAAVRALATDRLGRFANGLGSINTSAPKPPAASPDPAQPARQAEPDPIPVEVHSPTPTPFALLQSLLLPVVSPLATAAVVFVVAIFMLWQREDLRDRIIRLFGSDDLHRTTAALDDAGRRLGRYYLSLLAVNTGFGALIGGGLLFIGVPSPFLWGILAGLLRFVPYLGSVAGAFFPLLLAAAVDPGWRMVVEAAALFLVIEPVLGQVVEPMIYGRSTGLSPVSVVIAAIFWGWIWGAIGLLLSMPLTLCLVVLGKHVQRLEFLYVLLGDKPALSPAESLYQRMLVGDADEALEQAEALLQDGSLAEYYDVVAVPALQLAANDSLRGVLTDEQLQGIMEAICGIVVDLSEQVARPEAAASGVASSTVLCVAGRGPLDEAVCAMLADMLSRAGQRARVATAAMTRRPLLEQLDVADVDTVVISHLEGADAIAPLRYLVRRLRQRAPAAKVVAGLWLACEEPASLSRMADAIAADQIVHTISAAVAACAPALEVAPVEEEVA